MFQLKKNKISFRVSIATIMIVLTVSLSAVFLLVAYKTFTTATVRSANGLFREIASGLVKQADSLLTTAGSISEAGAFLQSDEQIDRLLQMEGTLFRFMVKTLGQNDLLHSLFVQRKDGELIRLIALRQDTYLYDYFRAHRASLYILQHIAQDGMLVRQYHLDKDLSVINNDTAGKQARTLSRSWLDRQQGHDGLLFTEPYIFDHVPLPGISCTVPAGDGSSVFGADITLERFTRFLWNQQVSPFGNAFMFTVDGRLIAHPREPAVSVVKRGQAEEIWFVALENSTRPEVRAIWQYSQRTLIPLSGVSDNILVDGESQIMHLTALDHTGLRLLFAVNAPADDFSGPFQELQRLILRISSVAVILAVTASFFFAKRLSNALSQLAKSARKVQHFDFSEECVFHSRILEIDTLITSFSIMRLTVRQRTDALLATQNRLQQLVEDGIALASQNEEKELAQLTIVKAKELAGAGGGILYRYADDDTLVPELLVGGSMRLPCSAVTEHLPKAGNITVRAGEQDPLLEKMSEAVMRRRISQVSGYRGDGPLADLVKVLGGMDTNLLIPLTTRKDKVVGLLQLVFPCRDEGDSALHPFLSLLAAQAATAMDNQRLLKSQQLLLDSFIKVLAGAIDAKSPHTGRHCSRVPELALLLARAANECNTGALADFQFANHTDWHEFETAAWLHDCGKIVTPEYVVNKATKLETVHNRLHEIRLRFEIIRRDLHLRVLSGHSGLNLEEEYRQLEDDFAFIAGCNRGTETMSDVDRQRIRRIGAKTWQSHFSGRLGLSEEELVRIPSQVLDTGPQQLLADRPDHLIPYEHGAMTGPDMNRFNLERPSHRMNLGEIYNLSIAKGTLTPEERFTIQKHSIQSIFMLESLPFPSHMRRVVEFACRHHEKVNGSGYPLGLSGKEMSVPAKILAIADIFEALTASDRPYKQAMCVKNALLLMTRMVEAGEIDPELFRLFTDSDVIDRYLSQVNLKESAVDPSGSTVCKALSSRAV